MCPVGFTFVLGPSRRPNFLLVFENVTKDPPVGILGEYAFTI